LFDIMKPRTIQSISRALDVLEELSNSPQGLGLMELAEKLNLNKSTAHHILATLVEHRFAKQNSSTKRYGVDSRLIHLAHCAADNLNVVQEAEPVLSRLAEESNEVAHLMILDKGEIVYLLKLESAENTHSLKLASYVGMRNAAHSSAGGKALLSHLDEKQLAEIITERGLARRSKNTITDPDELRKELSQVREQGFAIDDEENEEGVRCVGAPVRDARGRVIAAISVSGPRFRLSMNTVRRRLAPQVVNAAKEISLCLGFDETVTV